MSSNKQLIAPVSPISSVLVSFRNETLFQSIYFQTVFPKTSNISHHPGSSTLPIANNVSSKVLLSFSRTILTPLITT